MRSGWRGASAGPGPGAYQTRKSAEECTGAKGSGGTHGGFRRSQAYSIASCVRSDFTRPGSMDEPGPGQYDTDVGIKRQDLRQRRSGTTRFSKDTNRHSFMMPNGVPGPGSYDVDKARPNTTSKVPRGFSFGMKTDHGGAMTTRNTVPGPGAYRRPEGKGVAKSMGDAPTWGFGTARRGEDKMFISKLSSQPDPSSPGPGAYGGIDGGWTVTRFSVVKRFDNKPAFSFGTAARPPLATVKF